MQKGGDPLPNSADLQGKTMILVVDDEKIIRLIVCSRLKREGYAPVAVASVDEAVHVLKTHPRAFIAIISAIIAIVSSIISAISLVRICSSGLRKRREKMRLRSR